MHQKQHEKMPIGYATFLGILIAGGLSIMSAVIWEDFNFQRDPYPSYDQVVEIIGRVGDHPGEQLGLLARAPSGQQLLIPFDKDSMFDRGLRPKRVLQRVYADGHVVYKILD